MDGEAILSLHDVRMMFPNGTCALRGVNLEVAAGEVHGLLGANGAGKSTLIKILSGALTATGGRVVWKGRDVSWATPGHANDMGVATVHQHTPLIPSLSVLENIFLADTGLWRKNSRYVKRFEDLCDQIGYRLEPDRLVRELPIGQRQMVAIFQALSKGADLIVLDEPTASLAAGEREVVYDIVSRLSKTEKKAIVFVSHFLDEVVSLTDRVTILRDGETAKKADTSDIDQAEIAEAIAGKELVILERRYSPGDTSGRPRGDRPIVLELQELASPGLFEPISLKLAVGEVIGIAGLLGSGRSEVLHAIYGADRHAVGEVLMNGKKMTRSTAAAVKMGIGLVPEDRMQQGLVPGFEIWRNVTLPALEGVSWTRWFPLRPVERQRGAAAIASLSIKADSPDTLVSQLSGGNAQKVTIAKWLFSDVKVFLLDEPTAGIDISAKTEILKLVRKLAAEGKSVIIVSSEFEELLAVSDRILVMRDGRIVTERTTDETSEQDLIVLTGGEVKPEAIALNNAERTCI